jgi:hypothetical protein
MTATLMESPRVGTGARLRVRREEIVFGDVAPGRVRIEVTIRNEGDEPSHPTDAELMAAPFGAFVRWQPLVTLPVPAIEAGESAVLATEVARVASRPLGPPDRVSPRQLLTAVGAADGENRPARSNALRLVRPASRRVSALSNLFTSRRRQTSTAQSALPADLFELMGRGGLHFAGNLNVFVAGRDVERHLARAIRIYPGRTNLAMFLVGTAPDAYAFHLTGYGAGWDAAIFDVTSLDSLALCLKNGSLITPTQWVETSGPRALTLVLCPPSHCRKSNVAVHVRQRSSGREAVVEFGFDPDASGPGCYVVG